MWRWSKGGLIPAAGVILAASLVAGETRCGAAAMGPGVAEERNVSGRTGEGIQDEFLAPKKRLSAREWARKGSEFMASGEFEKASTALGNAIGLNEGFLYLSGKKAAMHMRYGNCDLAGSELKKIEDLEALLASLHYERGVALQESGKIRDAVLDFDRAVRLDPNLSIAALARGRAYRQMGDYRRAIEDYNLVLKKNPKDSTAYCERGGAYIGLEFYSLALRDCDKAIEIDPGLARAYFERGISYQKMGNPERGLENFRKAAMLGSREARETLKAAGVQW